MTRRTYQNDRIRVFWDSRKCIHSLNCVNGLPTVFDRHRKPWVSINAAEAEEIKRVVETCPSGALTCELVGDQDRQEASVCVVKNGPYQVKGKVKLVRPDGTQVETGDCFALCRCGQSRNKPFCDGTHTRIGFNDDR